MIVKKKKSLISRLMLPLILLVVFAGLLVLAILLGDYEKQKEEETGEVNTIEKIEGEGDNQRLFPPLVMSQINRVSIDNLEDKGKYSFMRYGEKQEYYLFYDDGTGKETPYLPFISTVDSYFSYSSLLATEALGSTNVSLIYNLTTAVGNVRFSERLPLLEEEAERESQLKTYGLSDGEYKTVSIWFARDKDSENEKITLRIGAPVITGTGYYLMIEGRDYIYAAATAALDICMNPYTYYIAPRLTAAGISSDPVYMPYLTPKFKHWKNTWVREAGRVVTEGARVIVHGVQHTPVSLDPKDPTLVPDGYIYSDARDISFHLANLTGAEYTRLKNVLVGRAIGDYSDAPLLVTMLGGGRVISLGENTDLAYEYRIQKVESALTDSGERETGTVSEDTLLKVTYDLYLDGVKKNPVPLHSVIDITEKEESAIPLDAREALRGATLGEVLDTPVVFTVLYTKDNTRVTKTELYLENILAIYDQNGKSLDKITENAIVTYRYYYVIDGKKQESVTDSFNMKLDAEGTGNDVRDKFLGLSMGKLDAPMLLNSKVEYEEIFRDFVMYELTEICYFIERECIVDFSYIQIASERDPFYSESLYQNFTPGKNKLYSLNSGTCETVAQIFGGMGANTSSTTGLVGNKTVAVGLTPEVMEEYGLYAHTVYYELPRGLITLDSEDENTEDFDWHEVLGFTLYISDEKDGIRYVGSDLYDVVVEISAENFVFVEYDFVTFWARRQLVLVDVNEIAKIDLTFDMSDLSGKLSFATSIREHALEAGGTYKELLVNMTPSAGFTNQWIEEYLSKTNGTYLPLNSYYDYVNGTKDMEFGNDYAGAGYYKEVIQMLFFTTYLGLLEEGEGETVATSDKPIFKMRITLREGVLPYVYEFYRVDDRRVAVRMYKEWEEGTPSGGEEVCDFYISTYAMKKVINGFLALSRGDVIDAPDFGYGD